LAEPPAKRSLPLQAILTLLFVAIIVAIAGGLVLYSHERLTRIVKEEAQGNFDRVSDAVGRQMSGAVGSAQVFLQTAALGLDIDAPPDRLVPLLTRLLHQIEGINPAVTRLSFGRSDGRFYVVFDLSHGVPAEIHPIVTPDAAYAIRIGAQTGVGIGDGGEEHWMVVNADLKTLNRTRVSVTNYDPRLRPWYQDAIKAGGLALTEPYQFAPLPVVGITLAQILEESPRDVLSIDVDLEDLNRQLASLRQSPDMELFVFDSAGHLIAHPDDAQFSKDLTADDPIQTLIPIAQLTEPRLTALYQSYQQDADPDDRLVMIQDRLYMARFEPIKGPLHNLITAMAYPYDQVVGPANRLRTRLLVVGMIAIAVGAFIVLLVSGRVTRPLRELQADVARIMKFDFEEPPIRGSRIGEILALDDAVTAMRTALRQFSRYVPSQLVQNLLTHRVQPELGGRRQPLTLLFSDVVGFTTMAENLDPEILTRMVSRYFSAVGAALVESGGTIDKYLGDAVMAFWNAPVEQPDHVHRACQGALEAAVRVTRLNAEFEAEGLPVMPTRFGLHTGEVVVGTVGSVDRINYTALGHVVNLASRIEGLNKRYGTTLLVSDAIRQAADSDFLFRYVDSVVPLGATEPIALYELLGLRDKLAEAGDRVTLWDEACARYYARDWDEATTLFERFLTRWPDDRLCLLYRERADLYRREPPPPDWKGVERVKTK
jgi:adenylate cyclase